MPVFELQTHIHAPIGRVFDLARSIDAHMHSTSQTGEKAIGGRTSGLIEEGETVTWEATHFWVKQHLSVRITKMDRPHFFEDQMLSGAFASMSHQHFFQDLNGSTEMKDVFTFQAPLGILGRLAENLFLTNYMTKFLQKRNQTLKDLAESDSWRKYL